MKKIFFFMSLLINHFAIAAVPINLAHQSVNFLLSKTLDSNQITFKERSRTTDFNRTLHVRLDQLYQGHRVLGGDSVLHIPDAGRSTKPFKTLLNKQSFMNGIVYKGLQQDLSSIQSNSLTEQQLNYVMSHLISEYQKKSNAITIKDQQGELIVYVDKQNKAHWAYQISFLVPARLHDAPEKPTYIIDASTNAIYQQWNDIQTLDSVQAGGFGGNEKAGKKEFDGLPGHGASFKVERDPISNLCFMKNDQVVLYDVNNYKYKFETFSCQQKDPQHNHIYWNANHDQVLEDFSPSNNVMYGTDTTLKMFKEWYNLPLLKNLDGTPKVITIFVHDTMDNAIWDGSIAFFGDSVNSAEDNPWTQLDVVAHELGHAFTSQHSALQYSGQHGAINESFSDMTGVAAEYYAYGHTQFVIAYGVIKAKDKALRYMDQPSKDCEGKSPGNACSIDHYNQYSPKLNVHYGSGIFNRAYYTLATTKNWNPKKAYDVMVQANANYWTQFSNFSDAACDVVKATRDYKYNVQDVVKAFQVVGIDVKEC